MARRRTKPRNGDTVVFNSRITPFCPSIKPGTRATMLDAKHGNYAIVQVEGDDYGTTVPHYSIGLPGVLDQIAEALNEETHG